MAELQDIFAQHGTQYRQTHRLSPQQSKAMTAITDCRTSKLGGHADACPSCGYTKPSYNSCRNRHCPKCQSFAKERWLENQKFDLLDIRYFHVVFTVPDILNPLFLRNQESMYKLLFQASAQTLQQLALDKKYLGARIGMTSVLHTWGQNLMYHPHIHCIVTGGGLTQYGKWQNSRKKFFLPVKVVSRLFRGKFLALIKERFDPQEIHPLLDACYTKEWVVYCKPPFKDASCVMEYLGRYTHRVAISNNRILSTDANSATFKWRDYKDNNRWKVMTLFAEEFIRRFLLHILPKGFMKIRHYGILGNRNRTKNLLVCKRLTFTPIRAKEKLPSLALIQKLTGRDITTCPACGAAKLQFHSNLSPPCCA